MIKITLKIDGMRCGMCETHVNDVVRKSAPVKKVTSSHSKNRTVIVADDGIDLAAIREAIEQQGYRVLSAETEPYVKKGLFGGRL